MDERRRSERRGVAHATNDQGLVPRAVPHRNAGQKPLAGRSCAVAAVPDRALRGASSAARAALKVAQRFCFRFQGIADMAGPAAHPKSDAIDPEPTSTRRACLIFDLPQIHGAGELLAKAARSATKPLIEVVNH